MTLSGQYDLVTLQLSDAASPPGLVDVAAVADATSCDLVTGGWHYDSQANPTEIRLCEPSCDELTTGGLQVRILAGCAPSAP